MIMTNQLTIFTLKTSYEYLKAILLTNWTDYIDRINIIIIIIRKKCAKSGQFSHTANSQSEFGTDDWALRNNGIIRRRVHSLIKHSYMHRTECKIT